MTIIVSVQSLPPLKVYRYAYGTNLNKYNSNCKSQQINFLFPNKNMLRYHWNASNDRRVFRPSCQIYVTCLYKDLEIKKVITT